MSTRYRIETLQGKLVCELSGVSLEHAKKLGRRIAGRGKLRLRVISTKTPAKRSKKTPRPAPAKKRRRRARGKKAGKKKAGGKRKTRRNPASPAALDRADRTFKMWHGFGSRGYAMIRMSETPDVLVNLGELHAVEYVSNKFTGRKQRWRHVFHSPRPLLCTGPNAKGLFIQGGGYQVTERGLED